jgi:hypothetical protein
LERPTSVKECLSLLPTPSASRYGTSNNGNPGDGRDQYALKGKQSLWSMARNGLLPIPTVKGNYAKATPGDSKGGDGLATVVGGPLNPQFLEHLMGFPIGWTELEEK